MKKKNWCSNKMNHVVVIFVFLVVCIIFFILFPVKESFSTIPSISSDYNYLLSYFNLMYDNYPEIIQKKIHDFFQKTPILFICLKKNKERLNNVKSIIKKYKLKNVHLISAIEYESISFSKNNTCSIINDNKTYEITELTSETQKEIACFLSHVKTWLFASTLPSSSFVVIEDDCTFDFIHCVSESISSLQRQIDTDTSYLSLYTNKSDYSRDIFDFRLANFEKGYYGAVSYTMTRHLVSKFRQYVEVNSDKICPPKRKSLYISDHYFPNLFSLYHVPFSIIPPNNLHVYSSLHMEKNHHHIQIQYNYLLNNYYRQEMKILIPKILYLHRRSPFLSYFRYTHQSFRLSLVSSFNEGLDKIIKFGGYFVFHPTMKLKLPDNPKCFCTVTPSYIVSIKNHPYLTNIKKYGIMNIELNPYLQLFPVSHDYQYISMLSNEKFIFIISSYNNEKWVEKNLDSIHRQTYKNYEIIYVDDCSNDKTLSNVEKYKTVFTDKLQVYHNKKRKFQAYSRYRAYRKVDPQAILVLLDGDDWLFDENVLQSLKKVYEKGYNATYGKSVYFEDGKVQLDKYIPQESYPASVIQQSSYRQYKFFNVHLRTCRARVLQSIRESYLKDKSKKWLQHSTDMAEWFWIMEQTRGNVKFMDSITYVYNKDNSLLHENSWYYNKHTKERNEVIDHIRNMKNSTKL